MDLQLKDKNALVTGSSTGTGEAVAQVLASEGVSVVVHGRDEDKANAVVKSIVDEGGRAALAIGDLTDDDSAAQVAATAQAAFGGIDILVNNVGVVIHNPWFEGDAGTWLDDYNLNVVSMYRMVRALVPAMKQNGWGRVINLSSIGADVPFRQGFAAPNYASSKAGVKNLSAGLAHELAGTGITVNSVNPGFVLSQNVIAMLKGMGRAMGWGEDIDELEKKVVETMIPNPCNRAARPVEVANVVAFLASPLAAYINGSDIRVDGGANPTVQ